MSGAGCSFSITPSGALAVHRALGQLEYAKCWAGSCIKGRGAGSLLGSFCQAQWENVLSLPAVDFGSLVLLQAWAAEK